jgi:hypothetical protein
MGEQNEEDVILTSWKIAIITYVKKQGFSIFLLGIGLFMLWSSGVEKDKQIQTQLNDQNTRTQEQINGLETSINECNNYNRVTMEKTINDNTEAMREMAFEIKQMRND